MARRTNFCGAGVSSDEDVGVNHTGNKRNGEDAFEQERKVARRTFVPPCDEDAGTHLVSVHSVEGRCGKPRRSRKRKSDSAVIEKPKRALSAYNFFFRDERARILAETAIAALQDGESSPVDSAISSSVKRKGPLPHHKISFENLGKLIGSRWKGLSSEGRSKYQGMAEQDLKRHRDEMGEYYDKEDQRRRAALFPGQDGLSVQHEVVFSVKGNVKVPQSVTGASSLQAAAAEAMKEAGTLSAPCYAQRCTSMAPQAPSVAPQMPSPSLHLQQQQAAFSAMQQQMQAQAVGGLLLSLGVQPQQWLQQNLQNSQFASGQQAQAQRTCNK
jgi:hypothetical protein